MASDERDWYVPSTEEIKAQATCLGGWHPKAFDLWLAAHAAEVRERVAAEIIDTRRTDRVIKGAARSVKRIHVDRALIEAAARVLYGTHVEDVYPDGWLADVGLAAEQVEKGAPRD